MNETLNQRQLKVTVKCFTGQENICYSYVKGKEIHNTYCIKCDKYHYQDTIKEEEVTE